LSPWGSINKFVTKYSNRVHKLSYMKRHRESEPPILRALTVSNTGSRQTPETKTASDALVADTLPYGCRDRPSPTNRATAFSEPLSVP
jgi:hypothetical protein